MTARVTRRPRRQRSTDRTTRRLLAALAVLALAATGCLGEGGGASDAADGDLSGMTVEIMGAFTDPADEAFREAVAPFEEETGATVVYESSTDFETLINARVGGGTPPDIAMFPQPGFLAELARAGEIRPLEDVVDTAALEEALVPGLYDLGTVDGAYYGLPRVIALKSVVWYPPTPFADAGYEQPESYEELRELTETIAADSPEGQAPWCLGIDSGGSTGWVLTDWIEELLLRTAGPEAYDAWIAGDLPFDSPEVRRAAEMFAELVLTDGHVLGGRAATLSTPYGDAPAPMFNDPPGCLLHRQASFISGFFPDTVTLGEDVDVFYFPPVTEDGFAGRPVVGSGDLAALFTDNPAAEELMRFMTDPEWTGPQLETGYDFSPFADYPIEQYPTEVTQRQAEILADAEVFRFDASDLMPAVVGTGAFWDEMVRWVQGEVDLDTALQAIDAAWPEGERGNGGSAATEEGTDDA